MGIRLQGGFTSVKNNNQYVVNIYDSSYSSTVIPFDLAANGLSEEYNSNDKQRNHALITSKMRVKILIKNQDILDFFTDVTNAAEGRFLLEILKDGNKYWYGYIVPQLFTIADRRFGPDRVATIQAVDGIGRLKDIDYNNAGSAYTGKESFLDHLFNILGKIGFDSFYSGGEDYLITFVDWWDQNHTYNASTNPYELSRFDHRALILIDNSGETLYSSAYEVLEQIVKAWNCRFLFSNGAYYLVQTNEYKTDASTKVLKKYDKDKVLSTQSTADLSIWNKSTGNLERFQTIYDCYHNNGRFQYFPALRKVEVEYEHFSTDNLIPGNVWNQDASPTATYSTIDYNSGLARLIFNSTIESRADYDTDSEFEVVTYLFRITFQVGSYYLKRQYQFVNGNFRFGPVTWSSTLDYYYVATNWMYGNNFPIYTEVPITTPVLQESGDLSVTIAWLATYNSSGQQVFTSSTNYTRYWSWANTSVNVYVEGNLEGQTNFKVYTATNDSGSTNAETEAVAIQVGDGPSPNTFGHIEIYNGSSWVDSSGWRVGNSGSYIAFGQLLANEILAGQKTAVERYFGDVTGDYFAHGRLRRFNDTTVTNYVFIGGKHNLHKEVWAGEWFVVDVDKTGITEETPTDFFNRPYTVDRNKPPRTPNRPGINVPEGNDGVVVTPHDADENGPTQIDIDGQIPSGSEISTIPVDVIPADDFLKDGDTVIILTPTGEEIPVIVDGDVNAGDTTVDIVPITPGIDIPEGSVIQVDPVDLFAFVQRQRVKYLRFFSDIRVTDAIVDGDALFFFRVDESSDVYLNRASKLEVQVYTPGGGGGQYDYELKRDSTNIAAATVSETTTIARTSMSYPLIDGLYSFHISNITGTIPTGVNFLLQHVEPLQKVTFIDPNSTINGEYPADKEAFQNGVGVGELYQMSTGNYHGMPRGLVILNYVTIGYPTDSAAPVAADEWYAVATHNAFGVKRGAIRVKGYTGTTYDDDTAAGVGGVSIGDYYILGAANPYGLAKWFVKVRKT